MLFVIIVGFIVLWVFVGFWWSVAIVVITLAFIADNKAGVAVLTMVALGGVVYLIIRYGLDAILGILGLIP